MIAMNNVLRIALLGLSFAGASFVSGAPLAGCSSDDATTAGKRITLEARIASSPESKRFTNAAGWDVTITKAEVATGALYYFDGATIFAARPQRGGWGLRLVREAHAHPGHYVPGNARGEMLAASSADLLAGGVLGSGAGVSGPVRSATFSFASPAQGPFAADLGSHVAVLEGTATKGGATRVFRAEIGPDDVRNTKGATQLEGCPFAEADMQEDGTVTVTVKLTEWFDQVEFDEVPASADGNPVQMPAGLARNELVRGMKAGAGYLFSYAPR